MDKKLVRFDWAIKYLLRNKANFVILEGFLSELLKTDVKIATLLESESNKENLDDKTNRIDVFAELSGGEKVIIEVQCIRQWDFLSRILYGVSKVVVEHLNQGAPYGRIPRVISISIVYFDLGKGEDYIYRGRTEFTGIHRHDQLLLGDKEKEMYPERIQSVSDIYPDYYLLKVNQFKNSVKDKLDEWMYLFQNSAIQQNFQAKGISEAGKVLDILHLNESERRRYAYYMETLRDERSLIETHYDSGQRAGLQRGLQRGLEEGREQGIEQGKYLMAAAMKTKGLSLGDISEITGLSISEIAAL
jgi:predicted transposase/invertase (TIGR01784 family)